MPEVKIVVVGDEASQKEDLLYTYRTGTHPEQWKFSYKPAFGDYTETRTTPEGSELKIRYWNTACMTSDGAPSDYDKLRPLAYPCTHAFLVCISVVSPPPTETLKSVWIPELQHHCPGTPYLLVGTETDLRKDTGDAENTSGLSPSPITPEEGMKLAQELGAVKYVECSARTQDGLKNVFEEAIEIALKEHVRRRRKPRPTPICEI